MRRSSLFFVLSLALAAVPQFACSDSDNGNGQGNGDIPGQQQGGSEVHTRMIKSGLPRSDSAISDEQLKSFVKGQYDLNFDLIRSSKAQINEDNAMISTFSIQTALGMAWGGANGNTASEMKSALKFDENTHAALNKLDSLILSKNMEELNGEDFHMDAIEIKTSNNMYFSSEKYTWKSDWLNLLAANYGAGLQEINFSDNPEAARQYINKVVSDDTRERIKDLIPAGGITSDTQSVLTNAIYFKAPWADGMNKATDKMTFARLDNTTVEADYLQSAAHYDYLADELYQAVSVPLRQDAFRVMFIMPESGKFEELQDKLNGDLVNHIFDNMKREAEVILHMPSFSYTTSVELSDPLRSLGMLDAFSGNADFSLMTNEPNQLYISNIFHKTFIGLDENGVEAAAATAVVMADNEAHIEDKIINLNLDHPYFYIIYERTTHTPLFVGRVMDPTTK